MNGKRRRRRVQPDATEKKVIRCTLHLKPVFTTDNCNDFLAKTTTDGANQCKNCQHSS